MLGGGRGPGEGLVERKLRDALRSRGLLTNVFIVAGIDLPVLMLMKLQRGLIVKFRADVMKSPTACEVTISAGPAAARLTLSTESKIERSVPGVRIVIPKGRSSADFGSRKSTLHCTKPGDPFLAFHKADVIKPEDRRGVVISRAPPDRARGRGAAPPDCRPHQACPMAAPVFRDPNFSST